MTERRPPLAGEAPEPGTPRHASPLRVSLDVTAVPRLPAGAGRYTLDLAAQLGRREDVALSLVARADDAPRWRRLVPAAGTEALAPTPRPLRLLWEQAALPRLLDRLGVDVHHGPHYTMPEGTRLPRVVTIHDLSFFDHPEWHQRSKVALFRRAVRRAVRQAEALVCVSATTAAHLRELFSPAGEIHVVHHGVDHDRFRPGGDDDREDMRLLAKAGVRPPYVAFVGTIEPRKDVPTLLRAFDRMCRAHAGLTVVLAGGRGWGLEPVEAALRAARSPGRVRWLGYVSDELVPPLLRRSAAVAYPSLEEGFGLPVLEALACGAPVVTTWGSAMSEVAEGSALLVTPGDVPALAGALDMLVRGDESLDARRERGLATAAAHTWEASAAGHVRAYRSVLTIASGGASGGVSGDASGGARAG